PGPVHLPRPFPLPAVAVRLLLQPWSVILYRAFLFVRPRVWVVRVLAVPDFCRQCLALFQALARLDAFVPDRFVLFRHRFGLGLWFWAKPSRAVQRPVPGTVPPWE